MRIAVLSLLALVIAGSSSLATYLLTDPVSRADKAQRAVIAQYLAVYCMPSPPLDMADKVFVAGQAAALSRVMDAAGLGNLGLALYARCKVGLGR